MSPQEYGDDLAVVALRMSKSPIPPRARVVDPRA